MPIKYSQAVREDVATRLSGGQTPKQISETLNLSLKTVYRLKKSFILDGSAYISPPMGKTVREKINREKLIQLSEIMQRNANTTLKELMAQAVVEKVFERVDLDKSGYLDYTEFIVAAMENKKIMSKEKLL